MLPHDIPQRQLNLPPGDRSTAVIITGPSLRHLQFGYKLQAEFPGLLKRWWISGAPPKAHRRLAQGLEIVKRRDLRSLVKKVLKLATKPRPGRGDRHASEVRMFGKDVERLKSTAEIHPGEADVSSDDFYETLRKIDPYFLFSLGGPLLKSRIIKAVRGLAINQHSGWSPEYKGASTSMHALFHREVTFVGNTVHLLDTGADSGAILRRSTATLHPDDNEHDCFMAAIALGTDLFLEFLAEALECDSVPIFDQPHRGRTFLKLHNQDYVSANVRRDLEHGWLTDALQDLRDW